VKTKTFLRAYALAASLLLLLASFSCNRRETAQSKQAGVPARTPDRSAPPTPPDPRTQTERFETPYRVKPVAPPALARPPVTVARASLPPGAAGALPTFDGEPFHVNLSADVGRTVGEETAGGVILQVLRAFSWGRSPEEIKQTGKVTSPGAQSEAIEEAIKRARAEDEKRLTGKLGRLSDATKRELDENEKQFRADASRKQDVVVYDQLVGGVRVEHSGLLLVFQPGRGLAFISGRVFNDVNIKNQRRLDEAAATKAAADYVGRFTKVVAQQPTGGEGNEQPPPPKPELVILPYADAMRYAWRVDVRAEEGTYRLWLDAQSGEVLELEPQFWADAATGLVFNPNPTAGTEARIFRVNPPSAGSYSLVYITDEVVHSFLKVDNAGADGVSSGDVTVPAGSGSAQFNVPPFNGTAVERVTDTGYNSRFQEVNAYAWVFYDMKYFKDWGALRDDERDDDRHFPSITVTVNHAAPCGISSGGPDQACGGGGEMWMGIGSATTSGSTSPGAYFNSAIDATVVTHEFGHILTPYLMTTDGAVLTEAVNEGMSDYWAATIHNTPVFGAWWGHNGGTPVQGGAIPREAEALDVFPEHRAFGNDSHADGQMLSWALWSTRSGLLNKGALGVGELDSNLMRALHNYHGPGSTVNSTGTLHAAFLDMLEKLAHEFSTSSHINKLLAGFARAGIHLSERDAVIDISDDWLGRGAAAGPTFDVWGGRDYQIIGAVALPADVFNTRYEVEVANDAAFTVNRVTSGPLTGIAVNAQGVPTAAWTLPTADWNTLKAADRLYYRVTTMDDRGGNVRSSLQPGDNFLGSAVPAPYAFINESSRCECAPAVAAPTQSFLSWAVLLPPLAAFVWRRRARRKGAAA
jgi:hypothetical protein